MPIIRLFFAAILCAAWPHAATAGDYFFACVSPGGAYDLEEGDKKPELSQDGKKIDYQLVREITIREQAGVCTTKAGDSYQWESRNYLYEVSFEQDGASIEVMFLCELASSGIPANVTECRDQTTKDRRLEPTYVDVVK